MIRSAQRAARPERTAEPLPDFVDGLERAETAGHGSLATHPAPLPQHSLADVELVADGLALPESPVALDDGSVLLVEIRRGTLDRVTPDGSVDVVCFCGGGPNGVALGPDGAAYVVNNGRRHPNYEGGRVERVDLSSGERQVLFTSSEGRPLVRPNDIVFDPEGGFWLTDFGGPTHYEPETPYRLGAIHYVSSDLSSIRRSIPGLVEPNGVGISADGSALYFSETATGRCYRRAIVSPGVVEHTRDHDPETLLCGLPGLQMFDSLDVDAFGNVCVATLVSGRVTVIRPDDGAAVQLTLPTGFEDALLTNLSFASPSTAYLTLGQSGRLVRCTWPDSGALIDGASSLAG